jgi:hypothetical protein
VPLCVILVVVRGEVPLSYDNRYRACWPIPGGSRGTKEYLENLKTILSIIASNRLTIDELAYHVAVKFGAKYNWVRESLRICVIYTSLANQRNGKLELTEDSLEFLRTGDVTLLAKCFCKNIWGFNEMLYWLKEKPLETWELFAKFKQIGATWENDYQVRHRIEWLKSFGFIELRNGKHYLTPNGLKFIRTLAPSVTELTSNRIWETSITDEAQIQSVEMFDEDREVYNLKRKVKTYVKNNYLDTSSKTKSFSAQKWKPKDVLSSEYITVETMETEFDTYLNDLLKQRIDETVQFGRVFSSRLLESYLLKNFGPVLFFDPLLTLAQQYGVADVEIINEDGRKIGRTGFNLALFGDPGTGKTFASKDFILGDQDRGIPAHGLPGRNRYCGGMTPARFIQIGQAYEGRKFIFIVPELREWFTHSPGMVEPLKLAMEHGIITKETSREIIEPYRFTSFFSVNYNATIKSGGEYKVSMRDPNFNAIEDRMLCRLHVLTKERFTALAEAQTKTWRGEVKYELAAEIRDHLTTVHAIETGHPKIREMFERKPILLTNKFINAIEEARQRVLDKVDYQEDVLKFSPRLEIRALQVASAISLINYFRYEYKDVIPLDDHSINIALRFYLEEAYIRSKINK